MARVLRDRRLGLVWLVVRLCVGWTFLWAGWEKMDGGWFSSTAGLDGFLGNAGSARMTAGAHAPVATWFATLSNHLFLPADGFLTWLVPIGEFAIGAGLILGVFTAAAAFFGGLLNLLFLLAGSLSAGLNPIMLSLELLLVAAGPAAYLYGADRFLLPALRRALTRSASPSVETVPAQAASRRGPLEVRERALRLLLGAALLLLAWGYGWGGVHAIGALALALFALWSALPRLEPIDGWRTWPLH